MSEKSTFSLHPQQQQRKGSTQLLWEALLAEKTAMNNKGTVTSAS
jgi:hypothetical protein